MDEPIARVVGSSRDLSRVWRVPEFRFQHAFTLLPSLEELGGEAGGGGGGGGHDDPDRKMAGELSLLCYLRNGSEHFV